MSVSIPHEPWCPRATGLGFDCLCGADPLAPWRDPTAGTRHFWYEMTYGCDRCGHEVVFLLEDGCEGPRERDLPVPDDVRKRMEADRPDFLPPLPETWPGTKDGRHVLPVPFVAAACPKCQPGPPPHDLKGGALSHIRWSEDRKVDLTLGVERVKRAHFLYPRDRFAQDACGHPVTPW